VRLFGDDRPPYDVPSLASTRAVPYSGLRAISTFSGAGGSSLGLRRAGFRVLGANEFIPSARETYAANFPETTILPSDVRELEVEALLEAFDLRPGELDLLEGSPPCASFSLSNAKRGQVDFAEVRLYSDGVRQRTDDLFDEWLRLLEGLRPRAAVAENVAGIWEGAESSYRYFETILARIVRLGYRVEARILNAATFGAATSRRRTIIVAARENQGRIVWPAGGFELYSLGDALATCPPIPADELEAADFGPGSGPVEYAIYREWVGLEPGQSGERYYNLIRPALDRPLPTITQTGRIRAAASVTHPTEPRKLTATEAAWVSGFPADFVLAGTPAQRYERIGRAVPPPLYEAVGRALRAILSPEDRVPGVPVPEDPSPPLSVEYVGQGSLW
jgi:DNA (cytosine-5)-methyltransferase 1